MLTIADDMNLRRLYAERLFLVYCILPDGYKFPASLASAIHLTAVGEDILRSLLEEHPSLSMADAKAAIFGEFVSGGNFLVDHQSTSYEDVRAAVSQDIAEMKIRYPWVFGDILESAYIESYGQEPKNFLIHKETLAVLARLPQGVFQVADITVGPFGMIKVIQERCLPPSLCGPEILCFDPGCDGVHHVQFRTGETEAGVAYSSIDTSPRTEEMKKLIGDLVRPDEQYYRPDNDWGLPWLLMSGITSTEIRR